MSKIIILLIWAVSLVLGAPASAPIPITKRAVKAGALASLITLNSDSWHPVPARAGSKPLSSKQDQYFTLPMYEKMVQPGKRISVRYDSSRGVWEKSSPLAEMVRQSSIDQ